jgi:hypothetical protein
MLRHDGQIINKIVPWKTDFKFQDDLLYISFIAALHAQQLEELRDTYVRDRNALLLEASKEKQRIISGAKCNEELLQTISFQMLNEMETWISVWKETYKLKTDEIKNNVGRTGCVKLGSCWVLC